MHEDFVFSQLDDTMKNIVEVVLRVDVGCNFDDGDYGIYLINIIQGEIEKIDFDLFDEAIYERYARTNDLPDEVQFAIRLVESGEWEGYSWNKWYEIEGEPIDLLAE